MKIKTFDSVAMMRELRDALSRDLMGIPEGKRAQYLRERIAGNPLGSRFIRSKGCEETSESYGPKDPKSEP